ncbi:hypothetical protein FA13DRAFT_1466700 [Coprinellus micaceus]|uniref:Uncharacterized protein n=1 Tax=Coprinellus micaceus TaxID=71717 RepID=A0A4Y7SMG4_COPMI|nr:hypothetical protein FA13DRAFT_1466700 [Coprinellus micaceus]
MLFIRRIPQVRPGQPIGTPATRRRPLRLGQGTSKWPFPFHSHSPHLLHSQAHSSSAPPPVHPSIHRSRLARPPIDLLPILPICSPIRLSSRRLDLGDVILVTRVAQNDDVRGERREFLHDGARFWRCPGLGLGCSPGLRWGRRTDDGGCGPRTSMWNASIVEGGRGAEMGVEKQG